MTIRNFKTILITGASSGIGAALARHYAQSGRTLLLTGRDQVRLDEVAHVCRQRGAHVIPCVVDVTDGDAFKNWLLQIDDGHPVDLIVANAGISGGTGGSSETGWIPAEFKIFDVNVTGVLHTILPLLPRMIERRSGQIAIMSSLASFSGWPGAPAYSASKAAVRVYGEALRGAVSGAGVGVSVVCPGFVESRMTAVNNYKMPFFMTADKAACIIALGLIRNKARIVFPWQTSLISGCIGLLPPAFTAWLLAKLPAKPATSAKS